MTRIGFVGLGVMGSLMAARLRPAAEELYVYDNRSEALRAFVENGGVPCSSPAEVAARAETVFLSLPSPASVLSVVAGPDGLLIGGNLRACVDLSTIGPTMATDVASRCLEHGVGYLDSPVSGGPNGARDGRLTVMASGPEELFGAVRPWLDMLGANVLLVGVTAGQGQLTKLLNNLLSATAIAITSEAVALGVKGGLDPSLLLEAINSSSGRNTASADKFPRCVIPRTFDYGFRLSLMHKDVTLCLQEANNLATPMLLGTLVQQLWTAAALELPDDADSTAIALMFERMAGVTIGAETH